MKKIWVIFICLFSTFAFASEKVFELKMDLSIAGKHVSSPRILIKEGEKGTITQEGRQERSFIEVVAREDKTPTGKQAIFMNFVIGKITSDGSRIIISKPQIVSTNNEKSQITVGDKDKSDALTLSVIANKTIL